MQRQSILPATAIAATIAIGILLCSGSPRSVSGAETVSLASLLDEMVDRDAAARWPAHAYVCRQRSSCDPRTKTPSDPAGWFANDDCSQFLRVERREGREESVMFDAAGPGAIVRFWVTGDNPRGTLRIYLDGSEKPAVAERVDRLVGGDALVGAPLSSVEARGMNLYLPIPYAKRCVITYDRPNFWKTHRGEDMLYYQINYRTYEPGTPVESFSPAALALAAMKEKVAAVGKRLLNPAGSIGAGTEMLTPPPQTLKTNRSMTVVAQGAGAIRKISVKLDAKNLAAATRSTVLSITCDREETVWCPVGDFFGCGVGPHPFRTWWRETAADGTMSCYWVMPYSQSCAVRLKNVGPEDVKAAITVGRSPWAWDDRSMHFHTTWRHSFPLNTTHKSDWNYLTATGRGVYMGDTLALVNPVDVWWGEGDEKVYIDGEAFPSHIGTGTEDYYGYAWGTPAFFTSPFHAQPFAEGPANRGHVTNTRERVLDGISFTKSLRFDMEIWHWDQVDVSYAVATYWYGAPGATANHKPMPEMAKDLIPSPPKPPKVADALEGETLKVIEKTGGSTEVQAIREHKWSDGKQLWWIDGKPGDKLVLTVPVAKAGKYAVEANLTKAADYGIVRFALDGKSLGDAIDLYNNGVVTAVKTLSTAELTAGDHRLTIEIVGANPAAIKRHMFGLDYLRLVPKP